MFFLLPIIKPKFNSLICIKLFYQIKIYELVNLKGSNSNNLLQI